MPGQPRDHAIGARARPSRNILRALLPQHLGPGTPPRRGWRPQAQPPARRLYLSATATSWTSLTRQRRSAARRARFCLHRKVRSASSASSRDRCCRARTARTLHAGRTPSLSCIRNSSGTPLRRRLSSSRAATGRRGMGSRGRQRGSRERCNQDEPERGPARGALAPQAAS